MRYTLVEKRSLMLTRVPENPGERFEATCIHRVGGARERNISETGQNKPVLPLGPVLPPPGQGVGSKELNGRDYGEAGS